MRAHRLAVEQLGIDAVEPHGIAAPRKGIALRIGVEEIEHAALRLTIALKLKSCSSPSHSFIDHS